MGAQPMSRDEGIKWLWLASQALRRLSCGIQSSEVEWTAIQLEDRGRTWMLRQAREYRRAKILRSRESGGNACHLATPINVRASLFVAAILRAVAAGESSCA